MIPETAPAPAPAPTSSPAPAKDTSSVAQSASSQSVPAASSTVYLPATGEKYHKIPNCGRMNVAKARAVTVDEAIRLDAWAKDTAERQYNTEMQNDVEHDDVKKRSRFYQGLIDSPILKSGKKTRYKELPSTVIIFITQEDIFGKDMAKYTFTEQCEELPGLRLEDGTQKIFLNMSSKNGPPELISLLQYMKKTRLDNPDILVKDTRLITLDSVVNEVKQSEEWEDVKMSILSVGIERGTEIGKKLGTTIGKEIGKEIGAREARINDILTFLSELGAVPEPLEAQIRNETNPETLTSWLKKAARAASVEEFQAEILSSTVCKPEDVQKERKSL